MRQFPLPMTKPLTFLVILFSLRVSINLIIRFFLKYHLLGFIGNFFRYQICGLVFFLYGIVTSSYTEERYYYFSRFGEIMRNLSIITFSSNQMKVTDIFSSDITLVCSGKDSIILKFQFLSQQHLNHRNYILLLHMFSKFA